LDPTHIGQYPLAEIALRYARYRAADISIEISRDDDMYVRGLRATLIITCK
jgi:hypothetical protein